MEAVNFQNLNIERFRLNFANYVIWMFEFNYFYVFLFQFKFLVISWREWKLEF